MAAWTETTTVDRTSDRWQRIRQACGTHAAEGIDLDGHADHVAATVEASTNTTAACSQSSGRAREQTAEGV